MTIFEFARFLFRLKLFFDIIYFYGDPFGLHTGAAAKRHVTAQLSFIFGTLFDTKDLRFRVGKCTPAIKTYGLYLKRKNTETQTGV